MSSQEADIRDNEEKSGPYPTLSISEMQPMSPTRHLPEEELLRVFNALDRNADGSLSSEEVLEALKMLRVPANEGRSFADYEAFSRYVRGREAHVSAMYDFMDENNDHQVSKAELLSSLRRLSVNHDSAQVERMVALIDADKDDAISYEEFRELSLLLPSTELKDVFRVWQRAAGFPGDPTSVYSIPREDRQISPKQKVVWKVLLAGGVAGVVSRTLTAPFDRIKVLLQSGGTLNGVKLNGIAHGARVIYAEGGVRSFWKGSGTNCIKIAPESAAKFFAYDRLRQLVAHDPSNPQIWERFVAGGLAGVVAQTLIYPLETAKALLGVAPSGTYRGLAHCLTHTVQTGGIKALFAGLKPSLLGILPYASIDLGCYFSFKSAWQARHPGEEPSVLTTLAMGAGSSVCGQVVAYPLALVRTRLQTQGSKGRPVLYSSMGDCFKQIVKKEGFRGLYSGLMANFSKSIPAIASSYVVYEKTTLYLNRF